MHFWLYCGILVIAQNCLCHLIINIMKYGNLLVTVSRLSDDGQLTDCVIILPNDVFGDIMVLASPPPVNPDDVNALTQKIFNGSLSNSISG